MKPIVLEIVCMLLICGCTREMPDMFGKPRGTVDAWKKRYPAEREESLSDTAVYASALKFEEGYDWKSDTLNADATLVLTRNGIPIVELPAGVHGKAGCGIDTHAICDGHLISWVSAGGRMSFYRDGEKLYDSPGTEIIKGLLETTGGSLLTLGQDGSRWTLRRDGKVESEGEGAIVGDLLCDCCPPSGALYRDGASMVFSYTMERGGRKAWFLVQDGKTTQISDEGTITDMKMRNGVLNIASIRESSGQSILLRGKEAVKVPSYSGGTWEDLRILRSDAKAYLLTGHIRKQGKVSTAVYGSNGAIASYDHTGQIAFNEKGWWYIFRDEGNLVFMPYRKSKAVSVPGNPYFASSVCAGFIGDDLYYGISPLPGQGRPAIMKNAGVKAFELDFNGFVTGISIRKETSVVP